MMTEDQINEALRDGQDAKELLDNEAFQRFSQFMRDKAIVQLRSMPTWNEEQVKEVFYRFKAIDSMEGLLDTKVKNMQRLQEDDR